MREYARVYFDGFRANGKIDFHQEVACEFPIMLFLDLMGLPQAQVKQFLDWTGELLHAPDGETLLRATNDVIAYLKTVIEERKQNPRDDIVTYGVQAKIEGGRA